jgi:hypothetical protein
MARPWLSTFFENALVGRVKRRISIRMVRFCRSAPDAKTFGGAVASGLRLVRAVDFHEHPVVNVIAKDLFDRAKAR